MKKVLILLFFVAVLWTFPQESFSYTVLTFENLSNAAPIPNGYGNLNWDNFNVLNNTTFNAAISGTMYGYINLSPADAGPPYVGTIQAKGNESFSFTGIYLSGNWANSLKVTVTGYLDGAQKSSQTVTLGYRSPQYFNFAGFTGIDKLVFSSWSDSNTQFIGNPYYSQQKYAFSMDDFTMEGPTAVPIPTAFWLLGSGVLGLVGVRRRFWK